MNVLIATDKFKDALPAIDICQNLTDGVLKIYPECNIEMLPLADGGEGTLEALQNALGGDFIECEVHNPLFQKIVARYLYISSTKTAIIEMARASGIELLAQKDRNCLKTTSLGTGELIMNAIEKEAKEIILTVGGTATNDAGMGMATALGFNFLDENQQKLEPIGENLSKVFSITKSKDLDYVHFTIATDVTNPFYGENGAAIVFAPQKGADKKATELLDNGLQKFSKILQKTFKKDVQIIAGAGAGGGMGGGASCFLNAKIQSAADWILDITQTSKKLDWADILITGEGKIDAQTWQGKLIDRLSKLAQEKKTGVILVGGTLQDIESINQQESVIFACSILNAPMLLPEALQLTQNLVYEQGLLLGKLLKHLDLSL
jgi:glycerate kinase